MPLPPPNPPEGKLLLSRIPNTSFIRITWPDGQHRSLVYEGRDADQKVAAFGISIERIPAALNYLWNFYHAYVIVEPGNKPPAPVSTGDTQASAQAI